MAHTKSINRFLISTNLKILKLTFAYSVCFFSSLFLPFVCILFMQTFSTVKIVFIEVLRVFLLFFFKQNEQTYERRKGKGIECHCQTISNVVAVLVWKKNRQPFSYSLSKIKLDCFILSQVLTTQFDTLIHISPTFRFQMEINRCWNNMRPFSPPVFFY